MKSHCIDAKSAAQKVSEMAMNNTYDLDKNIKRTKAFYFNVLYFNSYQLNVDIITVLWNNHL